MNAIEKKLIQLKKENRLGLIAHAVLGYPNMEKSLEIINSLISNGSDFLELQIPFSDPVADGETIMKACEVALKSGMDTDEAFELVGNLRRAVNVPILLMAYYNTIFRYGIKRFCKKAKDLRVSGIIVPDIPPEEEIAEKFITTSLEYDIYPIRVVSPSSSINRLEINARFARGFVYCISHFGVTGTKTVVDDRLTRYLQRVKQIMKLPVAVGFGLSKAEQIEALKGVADIVIVGSAIIKNYNEGGIKQVSSFIKSLKESTMGKGYI